MINKYENIQNTSANIDTKGIVWTDRIFSHPERTVRLGTSFSGIGAIEQALKQLNINYEIQFAGDIDDNCRKAYFANYDMTDDRWHTDIHQFSAAPYENEVDLLVGGAPCQAFSIRGKRGGFDDARGTLFSEFARLINECHPKVFIFENVKGLLSLDKGRTWEVIKDTFENLCGYDVYYQVLNSKDYGIPQSRDRIYCIGFRDETDFKYPAPIKLQHTLYDFLDDEFDEKYFLPVKGANFVTRTINHQKSYTQVNGDIMLCQKRNQQFNWHGDFVFHPLTLNSYESTFRPRMVCEPSAELQNNKDKIFNVEMFEEEYYVNNKLDMYSLIPAGDMRYKMVRHKVDVDTTIGRYRKFTPRECLRLMGFGDDFKQVVSDTETYRQSGNSIVVNVLKAILKQLDITKYGI
jgi:DNA (cytosine-5)-methyltransferase 1